MKKTIFAVIIAAVLVLGGISAYAIQGLDESKSTRILANDGYATITTETVGGEISVSASALLEAAASAEGGVHVTDTYSVFSMDSVFIQSLLSQTSGDVVNFRFGYNNKKTSVTFTIRDGQNQDIFADQGRCVAELPYQSASPADADHIIVSYSAGGAIPLSSYYPDAGYVHFQLAGNGTYAVSVNNVTFSDITNHWGKTYVEFLASRGVANGVGNQRFQPDGSVTRAQFVTFLSKISMEDVDTYSSTKFSDVPADQWYYHAVSWAVEANITSGVSNDRFAPNEKITREQMAQLTKNYLNYMSVDTEAIRSATDFKDASTISSWAVDAVSLCQTIAVISGYTDGSFRPTGTATRAEAATICARIIAYTMILPQ